ncbi:TetR/AcrR family transcriptional regulator [Nocardioides sp. HM23]|uniref:TetR/AcrR family transcriptional regulator n=1 Tax=Nocardioides bizhenqiangii TaxID=3095076 RepID=UPI002ACA65A5|nr:TetR/AcrR family transcriptional regulator [Nocardioides sp. HM23]MDZ5621012.1 TetR/AcrR family transcriptional regulator [Nocardioides sp. HM23]
MPTLTDRPSAARDRLLRTAAALFYADGINAVGVDRVIAEAQVTKSTFYRHFPSKEQLVVAYLEAIDNQFRDWFSTLDGEHEDPVDVLRAFYSGIALYLCGDDFRGCHFINAAAEEPNQGLPIRQAVMAHRSWFRKTVRETLERARFPAAAAATDNLVMLRDGAMVQGYLESPKSAGDALMRGFELTLKHPELFSPAA